MIILIFPVLALVILSLVISRRRRSRAINLDPMSDEWRTEYGNQRER